MQEMRRPFLGLTLKSQRCTKGNTTRNSFEEFAVLEGDALLGCRQCGGGRGCSPGIGADIVLLSTMEGLNHGCVPQPFTAYHTPSLSPLFIPLVSQKIQTKKQRHTTPAPRPPPLAKRESNPR